MYISEVFVRLKVCNREWGSESMQVREKSVWRVGIWERQGGESEGMVSMTETTGVPIR